MKFEIATCSATGSSYKEPVPVGTAKFSATCFDEDVNRVTPYYSVEVKATFDPETKTWKAEIVKQWEGRI